MEDGLFGMNGPTVMLLAQVELENEIALAVIPLQTLEVLNVTLLPLMEEPLAQKIAIQPLVPVSKIQFNHHRGSFVFD